MCMLKRAQGDRPWRVPLHDKLPQGSMRASLVRCDGTVKLRFPEPQRESLVAAIEVFGGTATPLCRRARRRNLAASSMQTLTENALSSRT